jgi:hypothetical protein
VPKFPHKTPRFFVFGAELVTLAVLTTLAPIGVLEAGARCIRLPWQPKDKCAEIKSRRFATPQASRDVALALESAFTHAVESLHKSRDCYRAIVYYGCQKQDHTSQIAVMTLGKLMDLHPKAVQPSLYATWSTYYEVVKKCLPNCKFPP